MENPPTARRRLHSYPFAASDDHEIETDYSTANDIFPIKVPLERVQIGSWKYTADDLNDIELLYELESSDLLISTIIRGTNGAAPATFRMRDISAADLSLVSLIPGSLESMVAKLTLETKSDIFYDSDVIPSESAGQSGAGDKLDCRIVTMTASVHEAGHLRDVLLFLRNGFMEELSADNLFLSPKKRGEQTASVDPSPAASPLTFLEGLPFWALYIPWWLYSRNVRVLLQRIILMYSIFSVVWASWQLYRHVNVIHVALEPIINALKLYLASVMDVVDEFLAWFTIWWATFLSPLNVFWGMFLPTVLQLVTPLKMFIVPCLSVFAPLWKCLSNSALLSALKPAFVAFYQLVGAVGQQLWTILCTLTKPLQYVWQSILNSRVAVAPLDFQRIRLSWAFSLVTNSLRSIGKGLASLIGVARTKQKQSKAQKYSSDVAPTPPPKQPYRQQRMPVYYSSPLTKEK